MPREEETNKTMETHITQVGVTTQTFLGMEIRTRAKGKTIIGHKAMPMVINHRRKGRNPSSNSKT